MNTIIRLFVLIPATIFALLVAWVGVGFAGLSLGSLLMASAFVGVPATLVGWTIRDHYKRKAMSDLEGTRP